MPRGRSYRQQKQAVQKMQVELAFHTAAKRRRRMIIERHERNLMLKDGRELELLEREAQHIYHVRTDRLEDKIEKYYLSRLDTMQAFREWKERHLQAEERGGLPMDTLHISR